jgi:hypothetical protein
MIGRILGKVLAAPVRLVNVPIQIASKVADAACGIKGRDIKDRDPLALKEVADAIEEAIK